MFGTVYFRADAFILQSSRFKDALQRMGCKKPIYVETTAVPDESFSFDTQAFKATDATGVSEERFNVLFLSRVEKVKGIYESIEAYRILKEKYPFVTMTIAGDGSDLKNVKEYVRSKGIEGVEFLGWISSSAKHKAFANADVYLFPTFWGEGCPCSVLEAIAYGLPVVTRPVGGIIDLFEKCNVGFMTESGEPKELAGLLQKLLLDIDLRLEISGHNRRYARDNFAASHVAGRLRQVYAEVLTSR